METCAIRVSDDQMRLAELLVQATCASSLSEAKRKIKQGGVRIDDVAETDPQALVETSKPFILNVGKRAYRRIEFIRD